jgi:hypothetical protein
MAKFKRSLMGGSFIEAKPKKTRQGAGKHTKHAASSSNSKPKRYRGQGR